MKNKKGLMLSIIGIISLIVITIGVTYAFFNYSKEGTKDNTLTTSTITFLYTEVSGVGNGISIVDAYPIEDGQGKLQSGSTKVFDFKVTSQTPTTASIPYEVTARKDNSSTLDEKAVKLYLTKVSGTTEDEVLLSKYSDLTQTSRVTSDKYIEKTIYTGKVPAGSSNYEQAFRLRMWISDDVDFSPVEDENGNITYPYNDKEFTVTVNVYADAKVITDEDTILASNNEISLIQAEGKKAIIVDDKDYNYELGLDSGTTDVNLKVETVSEDTTVKVEKIDSLAYGSNIKRLNATKNLSLEEGDNYFKITTTSLTGEEKVSTLNIHVGEYKENILNEADPVLSDNLVPIIIRNDGSVYKVDETYKWYDYEAKVWANTVVLKDTDTYGVGDMIPEEAIESYFVWIPRYKYKIFNTGSYTELTSIGNSTQEIEVVFENKETTPSTGTTVGSYLTHPAFTAFDTNGLCIGKFETGYDGATSTEEAGSDTTNVVNTSKIVIKPNVYSWRNITVGNAFKNSYDYLREQDSHMMKNTEWGAVAYLQHSSYGSQAGVRINNNSAYITGYAATEEPTLGYNTNGESIAGNRVESTALGVDGTYTVNYLNSLSNVASTTGNKTGVYDMSGGAYEYVMGYTTGAGSGKDLSGITNLYSNFYSNSTYTKYWDKYTSTVNTNYNNRKLGDATGEMGPFGSQVDPDGNTRYKSSWYGDYAYFANSANPWFVRGGHWSNGTTAGAFAFSNNTGGTNAIFSFRIVLAPNNN